MFRAIESLCGWIWKATELVRFAVKSPLFIWATVSEASLCGLVCVSPGYFIGSAFSEALRNGLAPRFFLVSLGYDVFRGRCLYDLLAVPRLLQAVWPRFGNRTEPLPSTELD